MNTRKKLNIAMIGHKRIPSREGGVEIVVKELATKMVNNGHSVTCFNRSGHHVSGSVYDDKIGTCYKGVKIQNVLTIDIKGAAAVSSSFFASIKALFGNYDIVHYHAEGPAFMCFIPKVSGKKIVVTIHGLDHKRAKWGNFSSWFIKQGEKNAVKYADKIIVLSKSDKNYFKETYNRETILIPNGVNRVKTIPPNIIAGKYSLLKNDYILFLGRIVPEKGLDYLIEAYKAIKTDKKLVIAGGSSDSKDYFYKLIERTKDNKNIIFTDFVQGREMEELYSNAYIYCLPSDVEGMPLSLLEAMSYGNCCLTSDLEVLKDVVGNCGLTFKKGNIDDLINKLEELLNNSEYVNKIKTESSKYICMKYNWDEVVDKTLSIYMEALNE